jgi:acetyl-CoA C-acetyltransferase
LEAEVLSDERSAEQRTPVLLGAAQLLEREEDPEKASQPVAMLEQVARAAARDAGLGDPALERIDTLGVVDSIGWRPANAPDLLAGRLGARPVRKLTTPVGGETPLSLANHLAGLIMSGQSGLGLIAGCHNFKTLNRARKAQVQLHWETGGEGAPELLGEITAGTSPREHLYGLILPAQIYPIFENALRARRGLGLEEHRRRVGELFARFTRVAAANSHAWFPVERSAEELITPTDDNRFIAYPYTKYLNAVMETDQAAAVLITSAAVARELGVPEERWVYWHGGAQSEELAWFPSERPDLADCPAMRTTASTALARAGASLDEIDHFDFYSCFPVAVEMACEMLGLDERDPRGFTVTGGLPYAGGPGNNYCLHALAAAMERVREGSGAKALLTGNGWYLTKHSATVISSAPREGGMPPDLDAGAVSAADPPAESPLVVVDQANGRARIESYTVFYDRGGAPLRGVAIGRLEGGDRFIANTAEDRQVLEDLLSREAVGREGRVSQRGERNFLELE